MNQIEAITPQKPSHATIGVLGVGRFGSALVSGFEKMAIPVLPRTRGATDPMAVWLSACEIVCLSVRDDQLAETVSVLHGANLSGKTVLMHAGTVSLDVLVPLADQGATIGKLHPLMSFSESDGKGIPKGTPFAYEGDVLPVIAPWIQAWEGQLHHVTGDQWRVYHLAAVLAANFLPLFIRGGGQLLQELTDGDFQKALTWLAPLVKASVAKGLDGSISRPYSGPAVRGDKEVLSLQTAFLQKNHPNWGELYRLASLQIQNEAAENLSAKKT